MEWKNWNFFSRSLFSRKMLTRNPIPAVLTTLTLTLSLACSNHGRDGRGSTTHIDEGAAVRASLPPSHLSQEEKFAIVATPQTPQEKKFSVLMDIPVFEKSAEEAEESTQKVLSWAQVELDKLAKMNTGDQQQLTLSNTFATLDGIFYEVNMVENRMAIFANTNLDKKLRHKASDLQVRIGQWYVDAMAREDVFHTMQAFAQSPMALSLKGEDKRLVEETMRDYRRIGLHLPKETQEKVKSLRKKITALSNDISNNIKSSNTHQIILTPEEVVGISADSLKQLQKNSDGNYIVHAGIYTEAEVIEKNAPREDVRKKVFTIRNQRAQESNKEIMENIIRKRAELAHLLGYQTWADYQIDGKMARTGKTALDFSLGLTRDLETKFQAEKMVLQDLKVKETQDPHAQLQVWDATYYTRLLEEQKYNLNMEELKKYFEYQRVLDGMFRIFENLFQLKIEKVPAPYKWDELVELIKISDSRNGRPLGYLYLDMFPRPNDEKYGHFAMFTIRTGRMLANKIYHRPVAALICNFPLPTAERPSLLSYDNVETLFHEFGHGLHGLLTQAKYSRFAGTSVPGDFVEAPSQMLQYFVHDKKVLDTFARNYLNPSDKIPSDTIAKIVESELATKGFFYRRQMSFAVLDLKMHTEIKEDDQDFDIIEFTNKILAEVYLPYPEGSSFITNFEHLFGGYDAGYYGYGWADRLAADMASVFEKSPRAFLNGKVGMKLRKEIYETGNSREINESIEAFLGRKPSNQAFLRKLGLLPSKPLKK